MRLMILLSGMVLCLSSCGFALRGTTTPLPARFDKTYFHDTLEEQEALHRRVKQLIIVGGGHLVPKAQATVAVNVGPVSMSSRQIALSGNGAIKEFERTYSTTVTVTEVATGIQLGSRVLSTTRNVQLDDRRALAGEEQSAVTKDVAERALSQAVMQYLKSF